MHGHIGKHILTHSCKLWSLLVLRQFETYAMTALSAFDFFPELPSFSILTELSPILSTISWSKGRTFNTRIDNTKRTLNIDVIVFNSDKIHPEWWQLWLPILTLWHNWTCYTHSCVVCSCSPTLWGTDQSHQLGRDLLVCE